MIKHIFKDPFYNYDKTICLGVRIIFVEKNVIKSSFIISRGPYYTSNKILYYFGVLVVSLGSLLHL